MAKRFGLKLTLPGAAESPHNIPGIPGHYRSDIPTPVGEAGELSLEAAKAAAKDESIYLELVEIPAEQVEECEKYAGAVNKAAREALIAEKVAVAGSRDRPAQAARQRIDEQKEG